MSIQDTKSTLPAGGNIKRVVYILASLAGTMTLSASVLLWVEKRPGRASSYALTSDLGDLHGFMAPRVAIEPKRWDCLILYPVSAASSRPKDAPRYHFLVDGGDKERRIEIGASWMRQDCGAPTLSSVDLPLAQVSYYRNAVGIGLVGDPAAAELSPRELEAAVELILQLQHRLAISADRIRFAWEIASQPSVGQQRWAQQLRQRLLSNP